MILEAHRFRYSAGSDLAIGRDHHGRLWYQQWGPHPETGAPAEQPLGWQPYAIHHGQEEAEELLRLKAELDLLKSDDERHYGAGGARDPLPCYEQEVFAEEQRREQRHRDLVALAAGSLAGQRAHYGNAISPPDTGAQQAMRNDIAECAADDALATLAAIERAEKGQEG